MRRKDFSRAQHKLPLIILTLSDPSELTKSFFNKMFDSQTVQQHHKFKSLQLNPATDTFIDKVLNRIVTSEGITHISKNRLIEIRTQSQRDMRNAIMTLQFSAAGYQMPRHQKISKGKMTSARISEKSSDQEDERMYAAAISNSDEEMKMTPRKGTKDSR